MSSVVMRQNDTRPFLDVLLKDRDGVIDLTNETVRFVAKSSDGTVKIDQTSTGSAVVIQASGTSGAVQYQWQEGDLDTPGVLLAEFEITNLSSQRASFPNQGHIEINVSRELST